MYADRCHQAASRRSAIAAFLLVVSAWTAATASPLAVGKYHECAIDVGTGRVACSGQDWYGETKMPGNTTFSSLAAGTHFTCGIRADTGRILCVGLNDVDQCTPPEGIVFGGDIAAYDAFACARRTNDSHVMCWGNYAPSVPPIALTHLVAGDGLLCGLGNDSFANCYGKQYGRRIPNDVALFGLSAGYGFVCGILVQGNLLSCWGQYAPVPPVGTRVSNITGSVDHVCGSLLDTGALRCFAGTSGTGDDIPPNVAISLAKFSGIEGEHFVILASGYRRTCGVRMSDGMVRCGGRTYVDLPSDIPFSQLVSGDYHTCGIRADTATVECFGRDAEHESTYPQGVRFLVLSASAESTCGIRAADRLLQCWGAGNARSYAEQYLADAGPPLYDIAINHFMVCGLTRNQTMFCWKNQYKMDGGRTTYLQLSAGYSHVCGIRANDSVAECFGSPQGGVTDSVPVGVQFESLTGAYYYMCGIRKDGLGQCWGRRSNAVGGPVVQAPVSTMFAVMAGSRYGMCGLQASREVVECWARSGCVTPAAQATESCLARKGEQPLGVRFQLITVAATYTCGHTYNNQTACWGVPEQRAANLSSGPLVPPTMLSPPVSRGDPSQTCADATANVALASDPLPMAVGGGVFATLLLVFVSARVLCRPAADVQLLSLPTAILRVLVVLLAMFDFVTDCILVSVVYARRAEALACSFDDALFFTVCLSVAIAAIAIPFVTNLVLLMRVVGDESEATNRWYIRNNTAVSIVYMLAGTNIEVASLLSSRVADHDVFRAPFSERTVHRLRYLSLVSNILEDLPQLGMQVAVALHTGDLTSAQLVSIVMSGSLLVVGIIKRVFFASAARGLDRLGRGGDPSTSREQSLSAADIRMSVKVATADNSSTATVSRDSIGDGEHSGSGNNR